MRPNPFLVLHCAIQSNPFGAESRILNPIYNTILIFILSYVLDHGALADGDEDDPDGPAFARRRPSALS